MKESGGTSEEPAGQKSGTQTRAINPPYGTDLLANAHTAGEVIPLVGFGDLVVDIDGDLKLAVGVKATGWNRKGDIH